MFSAARFPQGLNLMCDGQDLLLCHGVHGDAVSSRRCSSREAIDRVLGLLVAAGRTGSNSKRQAVMSSGGGPRGGGGTERLKAINTGQFTTSTVNGHS